MRYIAEVFLEFSRNYWENLMDVSNFINENPWMSDFVEATLL